MLADNSPSPAAGLALTSLPFLCCQFLQHTETENNSGHLDKFGNALSPVSTNNNKNNSLLFINDTVNDTTGDDLYEGEFTNAGDMDPSYYLHVLGAPLLVLIGTVGNMLSFFMFVRRPLKFQPASIYLAFLNLTDTALLVILFVSWLGWFDVDLYNKPGGCQIFTYGTYVFSFLSVWTVVSFTVERYIVVFHPLKRHVLCTRRRALTVVIFLAISSFVYYSYATWMTGIEVSYNELPTCTPKNRYFHATYLLSSVDTVITLIIPSVAIVVLNTCIFAKIAAMYRRRREGSLNPSLVAHTERSYPSSSSGNANDHRWWPHTHRAKRGSNSSIINGGRRDRITGGGGGGVGHLKNNILTKTCDAVLLQRLHTWHHHVPDRICVQQNDQRHNHTQCHRTEERNELLAGNGVAGNENHHCGSPSPGVHPAPLPRGRRNFQLKTTRVLLLISTVFLLLNLPSHAFRVFSFVKGEDYKFGRSLLVLHEICLFLYYMNFAANFFLYVAFSASFRQAFCKDCRRLLSALRRCCAGDRNSRDREMW